MGAGTTFTIRLPAILPEQDAAAPADSPDGAVHDQPGKHLVLVVDDDPAAA